MVVRTAERILVDEEQLQQAIQVVQQALEEQGIVADIEVTLYCDPEEMDAPELNVIVARVHQPVDVDLLIDSIAIIGQRLRAARLMKPALPLMVDIDPVW